jgi:hypothetical protein
MKLDATLAREIKAANGDGSRDAKFALLHRIDAAVKDMSTPEIMERFNEMLVKHGRAVTAICVAATIWVRLERLDRWQMKWAEAVLALWTTKPPMGAYRASFDDGLHPTRICEYAASFIKCSTED